MATELPEDVQARLLILARIEAQHAIPCAVIDRGVLKYRLPPELHDLDVHLHGVSGSILLEQEHLSRAAFRRLREHRHADLPEHALDRGRVHRELVHTSQPHLRAGCTVPMFDASHANELTGGVRQPAFSFCGILCRIAPYRARTPIRTSRGFGAGLN
jgi:hypothetical protein